MEINDISGAIVDRAMKIHQTLGPGLLDRIVEQFSLENNHFVAFSASPV